MGLTYLYDNDRQDLRIRFGTRRLKSLKFKCNLSIVVEEEKGARKRGDYTDYTRKKTAQNHH